MFSRTNLFQRSFSACINRHISTATATTFAAAKSPLNLAASAQSQSQSHFISSSSSYKRSLSSSSSHQSSSGNNDNCSNSNNSNHTHHNQRQTKSMYLIWPILGGISLLALYYISTSEDWKMRICRRISLRWLSRVWGTFNNYDLPSFVRVPLYKLWAIVFNANLDEADSALESYPNLQAFFTRRLKEGVRPLAPGIVSPVDGTVAVAGEVKESKIFIVKGLSYNLESFLGDFPQPSNPNNKLFFIIFYLGPGDYHGIHAPCDWAVQERRHYPGLLMSVSGFAVKILKNIFFENERVIILGKWLEGYISVGMVGATNVGSVKIPYEKDFTTNRADQNPNDPVDIAKYASPIASHKGEEIGFFHLGSSVVMVFEHSKDFQFDVRSGDKVKIGMGLECPVKASTSYMNERVDRSL